MGALTCDILFPPEIILHTRSQCRQVVVKVHDDMDEGVDEWGESSVAVGDKLETHVTRDGHEAVMRDMQQGDLIIFLPQNKEQGVKEVQELEQQISVSQVEQVIGEVLLLTAPDIETEIGSEEGGQKSYQVQDDVGQVVPDHCFRTLVGRAIPHHDPSRHQDE